MKFVDTSQTQLYKKFDNNLTLPSCVSNLFSTIILFLISKNFDFNNDEGIFFEYFDVFKTYKVYNFQMSTIEKLIDVKFNYFKPNKELTRVRLFFCIFLLARTTKEHETVNKRLWRHNRWSN